VETLYDPILEEKKLLTLERILIHIKKQFGFA